MHQNQQSYVLGVLQTLGSFSFSSDSDSSGKKLKIPTFYIRTDKKNKDLVEFCKNILGLRNTIYEYQYNGKNRNPQIMITIRDVGQLKNVIVPICYGNLLGERRMEFESWVKEIEENKLVPERFKIIPKLIRSGFFNKLEIYD